MSTSVLSMVRTLTCNELSNKTAVKIPEPVHQPATLARHAIRKTMVRAAQNNISQALAAKLPIIIAAVQAGTDPVKGPDTGKTGIVIGIYPDDTNQFVVKLDRIRGMREIRVVPRNWAAKRLGVQDPDEAFLIPRKKAKS